MSIDIWLNIRQPRFKAEMEIEIPGQQTIRYASEDPPENFPMDEYKQIIGDGKARVAVTTDIGIKDFGTGASASVTIVLTCNQDIPSIERAVYLAGEASRGYAHQCRAQAQAELEQIISQRPQLPR